MGQTVQIMNATQQQIRVYSFIETWVHVSVCLFVLGYFLCFPLLELWVWKLQAILGTNRTFCPIGLENTPPSADDVRMCFQRKEMLSTEGSQTILGSEEAKRTWPAPVQWDGRISALPVGTWPCVATACQSTMCQNRWHNDWLTGVTTGGREESKEWRTDRIYRFL